MKHYLIFLYFDKWATVALLPTHFEASLGEHTMPRSYVICHRKSRQTSQVALDGPSLAEAKRPPDSRNPEQHEIHLALNQTDTDDDGEKTLEKTVCVTLGRTADREGLVPLQNVRQE